MPGSVCKASVLTCRLFADAVVAQGGQGGFFTVSSKFPRKILYGDLPKKPDFPPYLPCRNCADGNHHRRQPALNKTIFMGDQP